jgi:hypothetical protein
MQFKNVTLSSIFSDFDLEPTVVNPPKLDSTLKNIVSVIYQNTTDRTGPWIAGGMGRQLVLGETSYNDVDIWFRDQAQYDQVLARLQDAFGDDMTEKYASPNAMTYTVGSNVVQLIKRRWYQNLDAVFADFDFTCCQVAVDDDLTAYGPGVQDAKDYKLKLNRLDPQAFLARYAKYMGYGYVMEPAEFLDIIENSTLNYEFDGTTLGY